MAFIDLLPIHHVSTEELSSASPEAIAALHRSLGEAAIGGRVLINNQLGAPTLFDYQKGRQRTFAELNYELYLRNQRVGLEPGALSRLRVDDIKTLEEFEQIFPEEG